MNKAIRVTIFVFFIFSSERARCCGADSIEPGIQFIHRLSWREILGMAHAQHKHIFVDCYTTWCGPCKRMEQDVFPLKEVGDIVNDSFISVQMQMDTSKSDDAATRRLYVDARFIEMHYKVSGYPTLLFFNPEGKILQRYLGARDKKEFVRLVRDVLSPQKDFYRLLGEFNRGRRDPDEMRYMARTASQLLGDTLLSQQIVNCLFSEPGVKDRFDRDNIELMRGLTKSSRDKGFDLFFRFPDSIDKVMDNEDYAQRMVHAILFREMILPELDRSEREQAIPDWNGLLKAITQKYSQYYAERLILGGKIRWAQLHKVWADYAKYLVQFIQKYDSSTPPIVATNGEDFVWNSRAWQIFQYSNDREELLCALDWSNRAVRMNPEADFIDTYANILYKLGFHDLALIWERVAMKQSPSNKGIQDNLSKMIRNEPTWPSSVESNKLIHGS